MNEYSSISIVKLDKLLNEGCLRYMCYATDVNEEEIKIENVPVVSKFLDVFLEELYGLPPLG